MRITPSEFEFLIAVLHPLDMSKPSDVDNLEGFTDGGSQTHAKQIRIAKQNALIQQMGICPFLKLLFVKGVLEGYLMLFKGCFKGCISVV